MMQPSFRAKIFSAIFKVFNFKKQIEKQSTFSKIKRSTSNFVPNHIARNYRVSTQIIDDKLIATFEDIEVTNTHLIFLHGGAYIFEASSIHWTFAQKILDRIHCRVTMVDYPLAPEQDYKATFQMVRQSYDHLLKTYPNDRFILIGDSAGGGLAMAFFQMLQEQKHPNLPSKIILLSPWLDLTMTNPAIKKVEHSDPILTLQMLQNAATKYVNGDDQDYYLLSPINGELKDFPPTITFYSSTELFYPDCLKLKSMVKDNHNFVFKEYQEMMHDWALFPIPESKKVLREVCAFVNG